MDLDHVFAWLERLPELDYYALLGVGESATLDEVRYGFQEFAAMFHPDAHPGRGDDEREALREIFTRGVEAYAVLSDPGLRARYDDELAASAMTPSLPRIQSVAPPPSSRASSALPPKLEDSVRMPSARPFARRAEELVEQGDLKQAKLQMVMATHRDPDNDALLAYLRHIEDQLKKR